MISLLFQGHIDIFVLLLFTLIFSLTFHEFGHAFSAKLLGDDTAQRMGRLTLNPVAHIDPFGLLMVMIIGFGYAKPVPVNPYRMSKPWGGAATAAAGPFMNLLIAIIAINVAVLVGGVGASETMQTLSVVLQFLTHFNILLMLFNLLPLGPLDGHWIMSWLLPKPMRITYDYFNNAYGSYLFLVLILLSVAGIPIFSFLMKFSDLFIPYITFVR